MPTRTLQIVLAGDPASASRAFKKVGDDAERMGKRVDHEGGRIRGFATITSKGFGRVGVAAGGMAVAGAGAAALLAKSFVSGATSINESLTKNEVLFGKHADAVDRFSQRTAENLGISRQAALEATGTFGNLFVALEIGPKKSAGMSVALTKLAGDLASFNNASPDEALEAIRSGLVGETEPLRRFGVNLNDATLRTEALRMGLIKNTKEALDPQTKALAVNSLLFKQTEKAQGDFARTSGGLANQQRILKARLADLGAEIGGKLMPVALRAVRVVNNALTGDWAKAWKGAKSIASDALKGLGSVVRGLWGVVGPALLAFGKFLVRKLKEGVSATPDVVFAAIKEIPPVVQRGYQVVGPSMESFGEFLMRNFRQGVRAMPGIVRAAIHDIPPVIKRGWEVAGPAMVSFGVFLRRKLISGLDRLGDALRGKIKDEIRHALRNPEDLIPSVRIGKTIFDKVMGPAGDGIGKRIGAAALGFMGGTAGGSGAGLMGADLDLGPFARIGAGMGLRVSSGLRPGSVTSSGNTSYHSSGDAIDMAGPPGAMGRFFQTMRGMFGSRLRELIYTPGGTGIKDGRPYTYSGQVAQDHYDHVHVAYTGPFGDGLGRFSSTAYGPPWGGIQGTGVTATGVDLKGSPHRYGVAVDPSVIPLGTRLKIKPNPFNYGGYFTAFDTGGAIKGNRLDFYDWRGRASQMQWGNRSVTVWTEDEAPTAAERRSGHAAPKSRPMSPREAFRQSQENASLQRGVALRTARRRGGGKWVMGPRGIPVLRGAGSGPSKTGDVSDLSGGEVAVDTSAEDERNRRLEENTRAMEAQNELLRGVQTELKRQTDRADQIQASDSFQLKKMFADVLSGQFGRGIIGRGFTPGTGKEWAY